MSFDTQISSFLIPSEIWSNGHTDTPNLPPLYLPARDALAIERRAMKGVNLRNEKRRYTLCCERIQGIVHELSDVSGILPKPLIWPTYHQENEKAPSARSYLAIMALIGRWMSKFLSKLPPDQLQFIYPRVSAIFSPPEDAECHLKCFELIANHPKAHSLFERAARDATLEDSPFVVSDMQCQRAFYMRYELLKVVAERGYGLVDVIEFM